MTFKPLTSPISLRRDRRLRARPLTGGIGTLEELCEMMCWSQIGIHRKPVGLVNTSSFYDHLLAHLSSSVAAGFVQPRFTAIWCTSLSSPLPSLSPHLSPPSLPTFPFLGGRARGLPPF